MSERRIELFGFSVTSDDEDDDYDFRTIMRRLQRSQNAMNFMGRLAFMSNMIDHQNDLQRANMRDQEKKNQILEQKVENDRVFNERQLVLKDKEIESNERVKMAKIKSDKEIELAKLQNSRGAREQEMEIACMKLANEKIKLEIREKELNFRKEFGLDKIELEKWKTNAEIDAEREKFEIKMSQKKRK